MPKLTWTQPRPKDTVNNTFAKLVVEREGIQTPCTESRPASLLPQAASATGGINKINGVVLGFRNVEDCKAGATT